MNKKKINYNVHLCQYLESFEPVFVGFLANGVGFCDDGWWWLPGKQAATNLMVTDGQTPHSLHRGSRTGGTVALYR